MRIGLYSLIGTRWKKAKILISFDLGFAFETLRRVVSTLVDNGVTFIVLVI